MPIESVQIGPYGYCAVAIGLTMHVDDITGAVAKYRPRAK